MEARLWGWIVAPILTVVLLCCVIIVFPVSDCGDSVEGKEVVPLIFVALAILAVVGAASFRVAAMVRRRQFKARDGLILAASLIVLAMSNVFFASADKGMFDWLAPGILIVTGIALSGLLVAAVAGRSVDAVGVLLPTYLFGIAFVYVLVGWLFAAASSGAFC